MTTEPIRPPAWVVLEQALRTRQAVRISYHGHERTICPHALGRKNGRVTVLAYQTAGHTSTGNLPDDPRQHWRSLHVDQIDHAAITLSPWRTADNYTPDTDSIDDLLIAVDP